MSALPYNTAVRQYRKPALPDQAGKQPWAGLDLFCTPPWATRALALIVLRRLGLSLQGLEILEPACGLGHMSDVLKEYGSNVFASDIFPHGYGRTYDFRTVPIQLPFHWTITNPPFNLAEVFALRALDISTTGVALLVRSAWLEGHGRYRRLFANNPPTMVAQFVERVPMVQGRWDPGAKTATAYAWVVWSKPHRGVEPRFMHIPPCRVEMSRPYDFDVFAHRRPPATGGAP